MTDIIRGPQTAIQKLLRVDFKFFNVVRLNLIQSSTVFHLY